MCICFCLYGPLIVGSFGISSHSLVVLTNTILFDATFYYVPTTPAMMHDNMIAVVAAVFYTEQENKNENRIHLVHDTFFFFEEENMREIKTEKNYAGSSCQCACEPFTMFRCVYDFNVVIWFV